MSVKITEPRVFAPAELITIQREFHVSSFNIPLYQRLYSWGNKEIEKLLNDIELAELDQKDYYIGNITFSHNTFSKSFDVIDGQQRLATLWLLGLVLKLKGEVRWNSFLLNDDEPILGFTARVADTSFLRKMAGSASIADLSVFDKTDVNDIMVAAIRTIEQYFNNKTSAEVNRLSEYIFHRLRMVAIYLPDGIDLNKYFEDMNNRGLQLEAHHILKANLLAKIDRSLHSSYAKIWDAVAQMNQYVEYGLKGTLKENRKKLENNAIPSSYFENSTDDTKDAALKDLITEGKSPEYKKPQDQPDPELISNKVGSLINFPEFLLHALKLYPGIDGVSNIPLEDKKLLDTFDELKDKIEADKFIKHLFRCRVLYDAYIVKSVEVAEGNRWEIRRIKVDEEKDVYIREKHFSEVVQVQAMLNAATSLPVWFTETLDYLLNEKEISPLLFLDFLEALDRKIARNLLGSRKLNEVLSAGTGTGRYWFYNLDYLLWKKWQKDEGFLPVADMERVTEHISNFQFRDNRSVEHIHPQHPEIESWPDGEIQPDTMDAEKLSALKNKFGNLALISVGSNSSYNNQSPKFKKGDFRNRSEKYGIESLKLAFAYAYEPWSVQNMELHGQQMIGIVREYHGWEASDN